MPIQDAISYEIRDTEFSLKEKIALSAFPDEVIRMALARYYEVKPSIREPIKYVFKLCWSLSNKMGLCPDWVWKNKLENMYNVMFREPVPLKADLPPEKFEQWKANKKNPPVPAAPLSDQKKIISFDAIPLTAEEEAFILRAPIERQALLREFLIKKNVSRLERENTPKVIPITKNQPIVTPIPIIQKVVIEKDPEVNKHTPGLISSLGVNHLFKSTTVVHVPKTPEEKLQEDIETKFRRRRSQELLNNWQQIENDKSLQEFNQRVLGFPPE